VIKYKRNEMGGACGMLGGEEKLIWGAGVGKLTERPEGNSEHWWECNIKRGSLRNKMGCGMD
jgi:hypothetical protein